MKKYIQPTTLLAVLTGVSDAWTFRLNSGYASPASAVHIRGHMSSTRLFEHPPGKVEDPDDWIRCVSNSLLKFYGKSLYEELSLSGPAKVHANEQHVVISHGTQDDPVYNYANRAGLLFFGYPEHEFVQLPSRFSAPEGALRADRSLIVQHVLDHGWSIIPEATRQNKDGDQFLVQRILYFNVYDDAGVRIGQAATFDREKVVQLATSSSATT